MEHLKLFHSDLGEPVLPINAEGARYWLKFTNDFTQGTWIYFMKEKSESLQKLQEFVTWIQQQSN